MKLKWEKDKWGEIKAKAEITSPLGGSYEIWITKRPDYCDRGDWIIQVDGYGTGSCLDEADGFPRYFFGTEEEVKKQMETWVSRRKELV